MNPLSTRNYPSIENPTPALPSSLIENPVTSLCLDLFRTLQSNMDVTTNDRAINALPDGSFSITFTDDSKRKEYQGMINSFFQMHGKNGYLTHEDGTIYQGEFKNDRMVGIFEVLFNKDELFSQYTGKIRENGLFEGRGVLTLKNGRIITAFFKNHFKNDFTDGEIKIVDPNLSTEYIGYLDDNFNKTGLGTFTISDGTQYIGPFLDDEFDDNGIFTIIDSQNLTSYKGKIDAKGLKQGEFEIEKTLIGEDNCPYIVQIKGTFIDDKPIGRFNIQRSPLVYDAEVDDNLDPTGQGTLSYNGNESIRFEGLFFKGTPIRGKIISSCRAEREESSELEGEALLLEYQRLVVVSSQ